MKILHVHKYYHAKDGAGRYMFDLMQLLESAGHVTAALAMHDPRNAPSAWEEYFVPEMDTSAARIGLKAFRQTLRSFWSKEAKERMERMLDVFKPDVVHVHNIYTHLSPSVLEPCRERGIPIVMTVHDYALVSANYTLWTRGSVIDVEHAGLWQTAKSKCVKGSLLATLTQDVIFRFHRALKWYDRSIVRYITLSGFVRDALMFAGYAKEKIQVIPPLAGPLLEEKHRASSRDMRSVLFAGRLESYKGIELYLELAARHPEVTFFVAGTGPLEGRVRQMAAAHKNIVYLGFLSAEHLWEKMASVRLVIVPSLWYEPFGLVALEAMALGTPVLVSDRGGLPELVRDSGGGKIFKAGDLKDLQKKFDALFGDSWDELSEQAKKYAKEKHSPQVFLTSMLEAYESVRDYGRS